MALEGEPTAMRLSMERLLAPRKDRPVGFPLRPINNARDAADAMSDVMKAVTSGQLTPANAEQISKVVACTVRAFEVAAMSERAISLDQLSDMELLRVIATGRYEPETSRAPRLLTVGPR
jgi:hypothetical protein